MAAVGPPLVQVGLVCVQEGRPVGGLDQEFVEAAGAGEAANGGVVEPQFTADRGQGLALSQPLLHRLVAFGGAGHQAPGAAREVERPVRRNERAAHRAGIAQAVGGRAAVLAGGTASRGHRDRSTTKGTHRSVRRVLSKVKQTPKVQRQVERGTAPTTLCPSRQWSSDDSSISQAEPQTHTRCRTGRASRADAGCADCTGRILGHPGDRQLLEQDQRKMDRQQRAGDVSAGLRLVRGQHSGDQGVQRRGRGLLLRPCGVDGAVRVRHIQLHRQHAQRTGTVARGMGGVPESVAARVRRR